MSDPASESDRATASVHRLDEATIASVAAGEVVTRPADVVVELIENSLDAGATRIEIEVAGDGTDRVRVSDDGRGMSRADTELAVERHTTSKLEPGASISAVGTLGFRGEALGSIATVATVELLTNDGGPRGTRVVAEGPEASRIEPAGRARGTTVTVRHLFADTPARRESLGTARTEFARVSDAVSRYALVRPDVSFSLTHDGSEVFSTPGTGGYDDALLGVYDRQVAARTIRFEATRDIETGPGGSPAEVDVEGTLVQPSITRARREHVFVAVDGGPPPGRGALDGSRRFARTAFGGRIRVRRRARDRTVPRAVSPL